MQCKGCGYGHSNVIETRHQDDDSIKRRRQCLRCGLRFTTIENPKQYKRKQLSLPRNVASK